MTMTENKVERQTFGDWLRSTRKTRGLMLKQLADLSKVSESTIVSIESRMHDERTRPIWVYEGLARGLDLELGYVLHRAGFDIGQDGVNLTRVTRVERALEVFRAAEHEMRSVLAEAINALEEQRAGSSRSDVALEDLVTGSWLREHAETAQGAVRKRLLRAADILDEHEAASLTVRDAEREQILARLARQLANVDLLSSRMREDVRPPIMREAPKRGTAQSMKMGGRAWTEADLQFIVDHPELSTAELAEKLERTPEAIRWRRRRLQNDHTERGER